MSHSLPFEYKEHFQRYNLSTKSEKIHKLINLRLLSCVARLRSATTKELFKQANVGEAGTGVGRLYSAHRQFDVNYHGFEPNSEMFLFTSNKFQDPNFTLTNIRIEGVGKELYQQLDSFFFVHVLEHAKHSYEALDWVKLARTLIKPSGIIIVKGPHFPSYGWKYFDTDWSHNFVTTRNNVAEVLLEAGFTEIRSTLTSGIGGNSYFMSSLTSILAKILPEELLNRLLKSILKKEMLASNLITALFRLDYVIVAKKSE
jgi:2-polyprenyl-3-methyl-5-hydroxy-6-metoxy-1,4-benzoquinol methylase